ncbi:TIMELESS-interacting protein isoform X3 [Manis pentadactyla]|uniref:TIMELESS-interacting protein isoform X3 n=1 Tax=Manis pentadactyla TaxID=143292 RepID=UPI00255CF5EA|nr:TIMELESS-interacting protein isoform X3 [Manis pentadactyla]
MPRKRGKPEEKMLEPQESGLVDLPDYEHIEDEIFPPFPPPATRGIDDGEGAEPYDEEGKNSGHDVTATKLEPFLTNSSESEKFASESSSRSLTEEQCQRIERNKQLALERRQAKLLSNSQSLQNDLLEDTPRAQTVEEVNPGEDKEEESSDGVNMDILDSPLNDAADHTINEEEALKLEKTQLDQSFKNAQ